MAVMGVDRLVMLLTEAKVPDLFVRSRCGRL